MDLKPKPVLVRLLSGEAWQLKSASPLTRLSQVKAEVFDWAFEHSSCEDSGFFDIELIHHGTVLHSDTQTLGVVGIAPGDEIQLIGKLDLPPGLVLSSDDSDPESTGTNGSL